MGIKEALVSALEGITPGCASVIDWDDIDAVLVISHKGTNQGDLHRTVRERLGVTIGGNKTHIDLTSGHDIAPGLSPIVDFFDQYSETFSYQARIRKENIASLVGNAGDEYGWQEDSITVTKIHPRNASQNPSAQLTELGDIVPLRTLLETGQSLVLLRHKSRFLDALGIPTTSDIEGLMDGKSKRMFLLSEAASPATIPMPAPPADEDDAVDIPAETEGESQGSKQDTEVGGLRQGRSRSAELTAAIELHAMNHITAGLTVLGWSVTDVHTGQQAIEAGLGRNPGFDILASKEGLEYGIEIKGTSGAGTSIEITPNELKSASGRDDWRLAIVSNIVIQRPSDAAIETLGGQSKFYKVTDRSALSESVERILSAAARERSLGLELEPGWRLNVDGQLFCQDDSFSS